MTTGTVTATAAEGSDLSSDVFIDETTPLFRNYIRSESAAAMSTSTRVDFLHTIDSEDRWPGQSSDWTGSETLAPRRTSSLGEVLPVLVNLQQIAERHLMRERREEEQRRAMQKVVLCVIAVHLLVLYLVDILLQLVPLLCGGGSGGDESSTRLVDIDEVIAVADAVAFYAELSIAIAFPVFALAALHMLRACERPFVAAVVMCAYSILSGLFFFSVSDLLFGSGQVHRDASLTVATLGVSLLVFGVFVLSERSPLQRLYCRLAVVAALVSGTIGVLLLLPDSVLHLPRGLQKLLQLGVPSSSSSSWSASSSASSVWSSHLMALLFTLISVSAALGILLLVRRVLAAKHSIEAENDAAAAAYLALRVLVEIELFFIMIPVRLIGCAGKAYTACYRRLEQAAQREQRLYNRPP